MRGSQGIAFGLARGLTRFLPGCLSLPLLLAGMAATSVTAPAAAQIITLGMPAAEVQALRTSESSIKKLVGDAYFAQFGGRCERFDAVLAELDSISENLLMPSIYAGLAAKSASELRRSGCPKGVARPDPRAAETRTTVALFGGGNWTSVPQINGGTRFDPGSGTEIPIISSESNLSGGSAGFSVVMPVPRVFFADRMYFRGSGSWFDGSARGNVAIGATNVAQTYIKPNPNGGSTGVFAGATGQTVNIDTSGHIIDVSFGVRKDLNVLPGVNPSPDPIRSPQHVVSGYLGLHYANYSRGDTIDQSSPTFADLTSRIDLDQNSHFIGADFGIGWTYVPPPNQTGLFAEARAFVRPGILISSASASQQSHCGPCGIGSPEFNVSLYEDFSSSHFSVIVGGSASVGYRFTPDMTASLFGSIEHMTGVPYFNVPTTPTQQPINFDGRDSVTSARIGARLVFAFGAPPPPPP